MGNKNSKSMSGSYSMKGTTPAGPSSKKKGSLTTPGVTTTTTNGSGPPPLSYPGEPADDENMNEIVDENVELTVMLPDGRIAGRKSVEANIPMMDLLINLAASNKLNPASHSLVVLTGDKWKQIDFKANRTIGLLAGEDRTVSVQIVKKKVEEKVRPKSTAQPFEMTYRFTVNLPHNQKQVLRISPKLTLADVRLMVCTEKGFDPKRYTFLLPSNPHEPLDDSTPVGDLKTSEINFFANTVIDAASTKSMPDLAYSIAMLGKDGEAAGAGGKRGSDGKRVSEGSAYMPAAGEKKAKKGFLSFLSKKDKKTMKIQNENHPSGEAGHPPRKSESFAAPARPKTMYADSGEAEHFNIRRTTGNLHAHEQTNRDFRKSTGSALLPVNEDASFVTREETISSVETNKLQHATDSLPKKSKKKRAAPPPPQRSGASQPHQVQVEIEMNHAQTNDTKIEDVADSRVQLKKLHSRNSSDSSGYHELTLSGADSPDNKDDTLHTIESSSHSDRFNGDSGIRDMSPVPRRSDKRGGGRAVSSRDSSLDVMADLSVPGKKKKRAPLPPPGMTANSNIASSATNSPVKEDNSPRRKEEEYAALQAMEEVTMKFNIDDSEDDDLGRHDDMRMVEDSSIYSEDLDVDVDVAHRQRPATFYAPPPPSEPPPEDSEPVDINSVVNYMDKIDIGVGEDTTSSGPSSVKSSPASIHRRASTLSTSPGDESDSSVNTLEDLSLAFKQTIAMGEEALALDSHSEGDNDSVQEELQKAMPDFKDKISRLAGEDPQATDSDSSFIVHDDKNSSPQRPPRSPRPHEGNRESSEITYEFTIDAVPPDFQSESGQAQNGDDDDDEEEIITEEVIEITHHSRPDSMEIGSPRRIPDLDSPKEHRTMSLPPHELFGNIPIDQSTPKVAQLQDEPVREVTVKAEKKKPEEPKEFVISLDDLSNLNFSVGDPEEIKKRQEKNLKQRMEAKTLFETKQQQQQENEYQEGEYDEDEDEDGYIKVENIVVVDHHNDLNFGKPVNHREPEVEPDQVEEGDSSLVKNQCSELSFSPSSEGELEHMMEEKSISMINLPAERTPVKKQTDHDRDSDNDDNEQDKTYASATRIVLGHNTSGASQSSTSEASTPRAGEGFEATQYQQMQQQFSLWQSQLTQNQALLASQAGRPAAGPQDDANSLQLQQLQLQIQMQQQMLLQLQQSMQSLALHNTLAAQQATPPHLQAPPPVVQATPPAPPTIQPQMITPQETSQTHTSAPTVQIFTKDNEKNRPETPPPPTAPPPPPVAPQVPAAASSKPRASKADAKYTKPKQRKFERALDPREQLMLDIRSKGRGGLKKVPTPQRFPSRPPTGTNKGRDDREPIFV